MSVPVWAVNTRDGNCNSLAWLTRGGLAALASDIRPRISKTNPIEKDIIPLSRYFWCDGKWEYDVCDLTFSRLRSFGMWLLSHRCEHLESRRNLLTSRVTVSFFQRTSYTMQLVAKALWGNCNSPCVLQVGHDGGPSRLNETFAFLWRGGVRRKQSHAMCSNHVTYLTVLDHLRGVVPRQQLLMQF